MGCILYAKTVGFVKTPLGRLPRILVSRVRGTTRGQGEGGTSSKEAGRPPAVFRRLSHPFPTLFSPYSHPVLALFTPSSHPVPTLFQRLMPTRLEPHCLGSECTTYLIGMGCGKRKGRAFHPCQSEPIRNRGGLAAYCTATLGRPQAVEIWPGGYPLMKIPCWAMLSLDVFYG
jgi:hypothetical protein